MNQATLSSHAYCW